MKIQRIAAILLLSLCLIPANSLISSSAFTANPITSTLVIPSQVYDDPIVITSNAELAALSSAGVGTRSDPYIIEDLDIASANCLTVVQTTAFFVIRDSIFTQRSSGVGSIETVSFSQVEHGTIEGCYVRGGDSAISISTSSDCVIIDCMTFGAYDGILLDSSTNCTIVDSTIFGNSIGAMLVSSSSCKIINNSLYGNSERGVHIGVLCENNTIAGNKIGWNTNSNAIDNGNNTVFTDGIVSGNEWADFNESEDYQIQGSGSSTDQFASRLADDDIPLLYDRLDFVVDVENTGETITWTVSDDFHYRYEIYVDDELLVSELWDGGSVTLGLDQFGVGIYTLTLSVFDGAGNEATDEVIMSVISFVLGGIGTELVMLASGVTFVCFIAIILVIKRYP